MVAHRVEGSYNGKVNTIEAEEIVELIRACTELPEYEGKTFGVISMVGEIQTDLINRLLINRLSADVYEKRRILCGNPAQFQGDERDVIFISMVDSQTNGNGPLTLRQDGADGMYKKRFNVASSRAKDQLWVIYSLDPQTHLKPNDIRRRLIEHAIDPSSLMNQLTASLQKTESPFEAEVFKILSSRGYKVTPQWQVGAYRIDMVAEGNGKRLAIECDGERWHYDKAEEDLGRQALLERLGWTFVRIRGSVFYRDKTPGRQVALLPLINRLKELGIEPNYESNSQPSDCVKHTLADAVKQKAAEIRVRSSSMTDLFNPLTTEASAVEPSALQPSAESHQTEVLPINKPEQPDLIDSQIQVPMFSAVTTQQVNRPIQFAIGTRVKHPKLGKGTVKVVKQFGGQVKELDIAFDDNPVIRTLSPDAVQVA
jgi:very-short-patch-repair endonuclease